MTHTPPAPRCDATGKARWPTREDAENSPQPGPHARPYLCPAGCNGWHLTSKPLRSYAPDRRRLRTRANRARRGAR